MSSLSSWLSQLAVTTWTNLRTVPQRAGASLASAFGVAGVVAVLVAVLSIAEGFRIALETAGSPDNAIVLRSGTDTEMNSSLDLDATRVIADVRASSGPAVR